MATIVTASTINIKSVEDFKDALQPCCMNLNKFFYAEPPKLDLNVRKLIQAEKAIEDKRDENEIAREHAQLIENIEKRNLENDINAVKTDWTAALNDAPRGTINDAALLDFELNCERADITKNDELQEQLLELQKQLPNQTHISADQFATFADEIMKRSAFIFDKLTQTFYNKIDEHRSSIKIFQRIMTYPRSKIYLRFAPRNIFDTVPGLRPKEAFDTPEQFELERRRVLSQLAEDVADQIHCRVSYGAPSFGPVHDVLFESCAEFQSLSGDYVPPTIMAVRKQLQEAEEVIVVSNSLVPAFWLAESDQSEVVQAHCNFVQASRLMMVHNDPDAAEAVYLSNPYVVLAGRLIVPEVLKTQQHDAATIVVSNPHPLVLDPNSPMNQDKALAKITLDKMFSKAKKQVSKLSFPTGLVKFEDLERAREKDDTDEAVQALSINGPFLQVKDKSFVSNMTTDVMWHYRDQHADLILPKADFSFRSLEDTFNFGLTNITPNFQILKSQAPYKLLINGLCFTRMTGSSQHASNPDAVGIKINFPARIFSHLLLKFDKCKGVVKMGYQLQNGMFRMDLSSGQVEQPPKGQFESSSIFQRQIKADDQLCLHYFYKCVKQFKCYLQIKLIREDTILDIAWLEVPAEQATFAMWLGDENDCVNIIKARLNSTQRYDQMIEDYE